MCGASNNAVPTAEMFLSNIIAAKWLKFGLCAHCEEIRKRKARRGRGSPENPPSFNVFFELRASFVSGVSWQAARVFFGFNLALGGFLEKYAF